jgi:hypothetical protein
VRRIDIRARLGAFVGRKSDEIIETKILCKNPNHPDALGEAKKRIRRRAGVFLVILIIGLVVGIVAILAAIISWTY